MNEINIVPYVGRDAGAARHLMVTRAAWWNPGVIDLPERGQILAPPATPLEGSCGAINR